MQGYIELADLRYGIPMSSPRSKKKRSGVVEVWVFHVDTVEMCECYRSAYDLYRERGVLGAGRFGRGIGANEDEDFLRLEIGMRRRIGIYEGLDGCASDVTIRVQSEDDRCLFPHEEHPTRD